MEISDISEFKDKQYRIILLFVVTSTFIISFDAQTGGFNPVDHTLTLGTFILSIIANVLYLSLLFTVLFAERIYQGSSNPNSFNEFKSTCTLFSLLSPFFVMGSSEVLYSGFGEIVLVIHILIFLIFGIALPIIWVIIDRRKLSFRLAAD